MRALLRKQWAAAIAFVVFLSGLTAARQDAISVFVGLVILNSVTVFLLIRLGLLALLAAFVCQLCFIENFPLTTQGSVWYAGISLARCV